MTEKAICELCGDPMPKGEEMFNYHGYSGDCPKPPLFKTVVNTENTELLKKDIKYLAEMLGVSYDIETGLYDDGSSNANIGMFPEPMYDDLKESHTNLELQLKEAQNVIERARCIQHWHDRKNGGMVVSGSHVRDLWEALMDYDEARGDKDE